jgi:hypothetical protein
MVLPWSMMRIDDVDVKDFPTGRHHIALCGLID